VDEILMKTATGEVSSPTAAVGSNHLPHLPGGRVP